MEYLASNICIRIFPRNIYRVNKYLRSNIWFEYLTWIFEDITNIYFWIFALEYLNGIFWQSWMFIRNISYHKEYFSRILVHTMHFYAMCRRNYCGINFPRIFSNNSDGAEPSLDAAKYRKSDSTDYNSDGNQSDMTVAYLSSGGSSSGKSQETSSSDYDSFYSSDDEPLSKYKKEEVRKDEGDTPSQGLPMDETTRQCKRGRPKGPAKPPKCDLTRPTSISHHKVRRHQIDEECERLGIYYRCWRPMNPQQTSHISVRELFDEREVPGQQELGKWCLLCPMNCYMHTKLLTLKHYRSVHHKKLLVVRDMKMWHCKCSEMHSHGSDNSAWNAHYHCFICYHPFKTSDLLATHFATQHPKLELAEIRHLMDANNPHRRSF